MNQNEFEPACRRMEWLDPFYKAVWEDAFAKAIPISGTFELTPRCNFHCRMCYVHLKTEQIPQYGRELSAKEWLRIAQEAKEAGTTWLCITGGEPLLHPDFEIIWRELNAMGFFITLQTNASLIDEHMKQLLEECPPRMVKVTLYGSNDAVYERVCGVPNGFTCVNDGIHTLMSLGIPVQLVSTIIRQNEEDIKQMAWYAYSHRLPLGFTSGIKRSVRGAETDVSALRVCGQNEAARKEQMNRLFQKPLDPTRKPCTYCKDYRLGYWVTWNGEMRFCSFMNEPHIPVQDMSFSDAWQQLIQYEEALDWPAECKTCPASGICSKCAATLVTECGGMNQVSEHFCGPVQRYYQQLINQKYGKGE